MSSQSKLIQIRSRKLGVLILDSRRTAHRSVEECAAAICVTPKEFSSFESGSASPSLPQLEMLSVYLSIPLEQFWSSQSLAKEFPDQSPDEKTRAFQLRNRIIGASLRLNREKLGLTIETVSAKSSIPAEDIRLYETGMAAIPLPELERLAETLDVPLPGFYDPSSPVRKLRQKQAPDPKLSDLTPELQRFISQPVNQPYLEIALRLSELPVGKLRTLAESLLEITF